MFDKFEKLRDFESQTGHKYADWDSLEKRLNENNKKSFQWVSAAIVAVLILIPFEVVDLFFNSETPTQSIIAATDTESLDAPIDSDVTYNVIQSSASGNNFISEGFENSVLPSTGDLDSKPSDDSKKSGSLLKPEVSDKLTLLPLVAYELSTDNSREPLTHSLTKETPFTRSFDIELGVKTSISNSVSNVGTPQNGWGTGLFVNAKYNMNKFFALGFGTGVSSEFNQNLNYSYITEIRSFFDRSDKILNIKTRQFYSANLSLSTHFKWCKRFVTSGGIYYNYVFQSMSDVHESGTGAFADLNGPIMKKAGYTGLLNQNEFGLSLSQTYNPNNNWAITLGIQKGLTNRMNTAYFPNSDSKRLELSLMISKRIGL